MLPRPLLCTALVALAAAPAAGAAGFDTGYSSWAIAGKFDTPCDGTTYPVCDDGPSALSGRLDDPNGLAIDAAGNVYVADYGDGVIRRVAPDGALTTLTTSGTFKTVRSLSDQPATFNRPPGVAVTPNGATLYIAVDNAGHGGQIMRVANGVTSVFAGSGVDCAPSTCAAPGTAATSPMTDPEGIALDAAGNLYVADAGANRIRRITPGGAITTVAGDGTTCADPTLAVPCGDGDPAATAQLTGPLGVGVSADGTTVFVADTGDNLIRRVVGGMIATIAGNGSSACGCGTVDTDNGPATGPTMSLVSPQNVSVDSAGNVFFSDAGNHRFREVTPDGIIRTIAGPGVVPGAGQAVMSVYLAPDSIIPDGSGGLIADDSGFEQVYWLTPGKPLGTPGPKGDNGANGSNGANGANGTNGANGADGAPAGSSPLASWTCRYRKRGIGRNAVDCFARVYAGDGAQVSAALVRKGRTVDSDSAPARDGIARLHLSSRARIRGAFALQISERSSGGHVTHETVRVAI